jgi:hypothetical protein
VLQKTSGCPVAILFGATALTLMGCTSGSSLESYVRAADQRSQEAVVGPVRPIGERAVQAEASGRPREALCLYVEAIRGLPEGMALAYDFELRSRVISTASHLDPPPALPTEAARAFIDADQKVEAVQGKPLADDGFGASSRPSQDERCAVRGSGGAGPRGVAGAGPERRRAHDPGDARRRGLLGPRAPVSLRDQASLPCAPAGARDRAPSLGRGAPPRRDVVDGRNAPRVS